MILAANFSDTSVVEAAFDGASKWVHSKGGFNEEMLKDAPLRKLINETANYLNQAISYGIKDTNISASMADSLKQSAGVFSGFKSYHEMKEAAALLIDENGNRKLFKQYLNDVQTINHTYNRNYLKTEYGFAIASAQMAAKWEEQAGDEDRYSLQYRTAGDDKVREEHQQLNGITLPASDPFWDNYYPPNGWACRCTVAKVRNAKYPPTKSSEAIRLGEKATRGKYQEMFRFNPGKQQAAYPAYNSYTISKCSACSKDGFTLSKVPNNELCAACKVLKEMKYAKEKAQKQYEAYGEKWRKDYFNEANGGYLVTEESRQAYGNRNKQEKAKYDKEHEMCLTYARAGYRVEHLGETPGVSSPDVRVNGTPADLKRTKGGGNIVKYAKKAISKQGAEIVLFQFEAVSVGVYKELHQLQEMGIHGKFFITGEDRIETF